MNDQKRKLIRTPGSEKVKLTDVYLIIKEANGQLTAFTNETGKETKR
jgi:hypothetical protein